MDTEHIKGLKLYLIGLVLEIHSLRALRLMIKYLEEVRRQQEAD